MSERRCARCGTPFECGADDPAGCWCAAVVVPPPRLRALVAELEGCLCPSCLSGAAR